MTGSQKEVVSIKRRWPAKRKAAILARGKVLNVEEDPRDLGAVCRSMPGDGLAGQIVMFLLGSEVET